MPPKNKAGSREIKPVTRQITDEEYRAIEQATGFPMENTNALFLIYAPYETKTLGAIGPADTVFNPGLGRNRQGRHPP